MSFKVGSVILGLLLAAATSVTTLSVQIKEYEVPTAKSRPHDPALAPDGSLWYTGQARTSSDASIRKPESSRNIR